MGKNIWSLFVLAMVAYFLAPSVVSFFGSGPGLIIGGLLLVGFVYGLFTQQLPDVSLPEFKAERKQCNNHNHRSPQRRHSSRR